MNRNKTLRALWILQQDGAVDREHAIGSRRFAELLWPRDDDRFRANWARVSNIGHGATRGVGMWRAGGSFLARLARDGYVVNAHASVSASLPSYYLTPKGLRTLDRGGFDPHRPERLGDAVEHRQRVRLRKEMQTVAGDIFPAGTECVISNHWRGRLNLDEVDVSGRCKGPERSIRRVSVRAVEFLPIPGSTRAAETAVVA